MSRSRTRTVDCEKLPLWRRPYAGIPHLREPDLETEDYPNFVVHDARMSGSITAGYTRLPLWCFVSEMVRGGWAKVADDRDIDSITEDQLATFLYYLLEARGDFGRLLCVLADVERRAMRASERDPNGVFTWWYHPKMKARVREALQRCIDSLDAPPPKLEPLTMKVTTIKY